MTQESKYNTEAWLKARRSEIMREYDGSDAAERMAHRIVELEDKVKQTRKRLYDQTEGGKIVHGVDSAFAGAAMLASGWQGGKGRQ